ncbi:hypothetical protein VPH35_099625 [Triticum aestivum]|uniref:Uncharacterized protein n=1 Tax=Aegilops tauschii subsp. strangulata TaxID=200361 RepID=A0A453LNM6_AEGTS
MLNSSQQPLHDHTNQCQLDAIAQAMSIKTQFNMSRDCFNSMVTSWGRSLPKGHKLAKSWYEAKKILRALKMPYEKIHACQTDVSYLRKSMPMTSIAPSAKPLGMSREISVMVRRSRAKSPQMFFDIFQSCQEFNAFT